MSRVALPALLALLLAGCGSDDGSFPITMTGPTPDTAPGEADRRQAPDPEDTVLAALAPLPGGGLRVGALRSGAITDILDAEGEPPAELPDVAEVAVRSGGQRGLVGLAVDGRGRTYAAFTARDGGRLVVERVAPGPARRVWTGPVGTPLATGGHLEPAPDGRLVIGVGDLQDPQRVDDPGAPNGKLLALDPAGPPAQEAEVLSSGWNNPYAFTFLPGGELWVVDNAPGRRPERIGRGDTGGGPPGDVTELPGRIAASGVAPLGARALAVCGVVSGRLDRFDRGEDGRWRRTDVLSRDCRFGVARLAGGRLAISGDAGIRTVAP